MIFVKGRAYMVRFYDHALGMEDADKEHTVILKSCLISKRAVPKSLLHSQDK